MTKFLLLILFSSVLLQGCGSSNNNEGNDQDHNPDPATPTTIVDVAVADGNFTTLVSALQATGLDNTLADTDSEFTVFAPTDDAFALLGQETIDSLLDDVETLSDILTYHVISSEVDAAAAIASAGSTVQMVNGDKVGLSLSGENLLVNLSTVTATDIQADNGIIHVIDAVLIPPVERGEPSMNIVETAIDAGNFTTLISALQVAGLDLVLLDETEIFTVFAPTDDAFEKIESTALTNLLADIPALTSVLQKHVISGAEVNSLAAYAANGTDVATAGGDNIDLELVNFTQTTNNDNDEVAYNSESKLLVGGANSASPGFTLYVFDNDLGLAGSACNGGCAYAWPPVLVTDEDVSNIPGLSIITRDDNSKQAAYLGRPLYFFQSDSAPGDTVGDGVGGVWWIVNQEQVSLQVQGSNVTITDIYTTNGVIHVIDTVIAN